MDYISVTPFISIVHIELHPYTIYDTSVVKVPLKLFQGDTFYGTTGSLSKV